MLRGLVINGVYKHFKGDIYGVIELSEPMELEEISKIAESNKLRIEAYKVSHTEKDMDIYIYELSDGVDTHYYHNERIEKSNLVIYKCLSNLNKYKVYARPVAMFLSKVDFDKYPEAEQEYRFEELKEPKVLFCKVGE